MFGSLIARWKQHAGSFYKRWYRSIASHLSFR